MASLSIEKVTKTFGHQSVLKDVSLDVRDGEFLTLVGASGCGKSTILRVIAGLEPQDSGSVLIDGCIVDHLRPKQRNVAMVFQSYALYPHMSVADNIAMPLVMQRLRLAERLPLVGRLSPRRGRVMAAVHGEVEAVARQLQIDQLLARRPAQLSGGQRQRVGICRALAMQPRYLLLDEVTSALDPEMTGDVLRILAELAADGTTMVFVTHEIEFARHISSRIVFLEQGELIVDLPTTKFFAEDGGLAVPRIRQFLSKMKKD